MSRYYANDGQGEDEEIEVGHEVEDRDTGKAGIVTYVSPTFVVARWYDDVQESVVDSTDLLHI